MPLWSRRHEARAGREARHERGSESLQSRAQSDRARSPFSSGGLRRLLSGHNKHAMSTREKQKRRAHVAAPNQRGARNAACTSTPQAPCRISVTCTTNSGCAGVPRSATATTREQTRAELVARAHARQNTPATGTTRAFSEACEQRSRLPSQASRRRAQPRFHARQ